MKKIYILITAVMLAFVFGATQMATSNSNGAPSGRTGAPGEGSCANCHGLVSPTDLNGGSVSIVIGGNPTSYVPGTVYPITVSISKGSTGYPRHGFQVTALTTTGNAGVTGFVSGIGNKITSSGNRQYVTHSNNSQPGATWSFDWTAPAAGTGSVTFYAIGNWTFSESQSNLNTKKLTLTENAITGIVPVTVASGIKCFPSPASDFTTVTGVLTKDADVTTQLISVTGAVVQENNLGQITSGEFTQVITFTSDVKTGNYLMRTLVDGIPTITRLVVSR